MIYANKSSNAKPKTDTNASSKQDVSLIHDFEVEKMLGISINTLRNWRYLHKGPRYIKIEGRNVMYKREDILEYIERQKMQ